MNYEQIYLDFFQKNIKGRYLTVETIEPFLHQLNSDFDFSIAGKSVLGKPIYKVMYGHGSVKIYIWSQMHGDESTCTKAILDLFNLLLNDEVFSSFIKKTYTLCILPMVNPDGAQLHTRENYNKVDLNRDVKECTQPESKLLKQIFEDFNPDYCFNMHDQRTIYGVGNTSKSATISFLAPAFNAARDIDAYRSKAMHLIVLMNLELQKWIPGQVGRYNDAYCDSCFGDYFASQNAVTILFEAGHFPGDYDRDVTRKYIFMGILTALYNIHENDIVSNNNSEYFKIPDNKVSFFDILYKNVKINENGIEKIVNFASQFKEKVEHQNIIFESYMVTLDGAYENYFGHKTYDLKGNLFQSSLCLFPTNEVKSDFIIGDKKFVNGLLIEH